MKKFIFLFTLILSYYSIGQIDYDTEIQPIFDANCIGCHVGAAAYTGGLDLTNYNELMEGGYTPGGVIYTDLLVDYISTGYMPMYGGSLSSDDINLITQWIEEGANPSQIEILGCTDPSACNFNPNATQDDESCGYEGAICIGPIIVNGILNEDCECVELETSCTLSDGTIVDSGWSGFGTGDNWCNSCFCEQGMLSCTELDCGEQECILDVDEDGICEDDCEEMAMIVVDCECSSIDPNTYTVFFTEIDEANCTLVEDCYCECINDTNNNNICDEEEELENDCPCINPDWIDPMAACPFIYDPVIGCDGVIYSNDCLAQAAGVTAWINDSTNEITVLEWDCEQTECIAELDPECIYMAVWDPVCGCNGVTYSNSGEAACNNIFEYTPGECEAIEEGCFENGEWFDFGDLLFIDECNYWECLSTLDTNDDVIYFWSDIITIDGCELEITGCTDPSACNFNPNATIDDNDNCFYEGDLECEDCGTLLDFNNYGDNELFTETYNAPPGLIITINFSGSTESCCDHVYVNGVEYDGVLDGVVVGGETLLIEWTTDSSVNSASGYGWSAELICEEPIYGCTQSYAENYDPNANTDDGSCELDCEYLLTYDSYVDLNYDNSVSNYYCSYYVTNGTYTIEEAESYGYNCDCVVVGCTDETALNYDEGAFIDDCSCIYETSCSSVSVTGGSYPTEVSWEIEDANGTIVLAGNAPFCQNFCFEDGCYTINMLDSYGDGWNNAVLSIDEYDYTFTTGSSAIAPFGYNNDNCIIEGCTNSLADNYNEEANYDNGSCEYGCEYLLTYESYQDLGFDNSISNYYCAYYLELGYYTIEEMINMGYNCDCVIVGCTDETATNYDEEAFIDDCSCTYDNDCPAISFNTTDSSLGWEITNIDGENIITYNSSGSEVGGYCGNYCFEDGCYIISMTSTWGGGWNGATLNIGNNTFTLTSGYDGIEAFSYNSNVDCEIGCTDQNASNYNPNAILDDGSCVVFGCTITTACNYNPNATAFDGSCYYCYMDDCNIYPNSAYDCEGNCINDWDNDAICDEYDNCVLDYNPDQADSNNNGIGDVCDANIDLVEQDDFIWKIYPNPFKNSTTVQFYNPNKEEFIISIVNIAGEHIYTSKTSSSSHTINHKFSSGYYIIEVKTNKKLLREVLIAE